MLDIEEGSEMLGVEVNKTMRIEIYDNAKLIQKLLKCDFGINCPTKNSNPVRYARLSMRDDTGDRQGCHVVRLLYCQSARIPDNVAYVKAFVEQSVVVLTFTLWTKETTNVYNLYIFCDSDIS